MKRDIALLLFAFGLISADRPAQNTYTLAKNYIVTIHGTSNLRNWKDSVGRVTGELIADLAGDGRVDVQSMHIKMEVRSIKSDIGSGMDKKTYTALRADANPEIIFLLDAPVKLTQVNPGGQGILLKGELTLAGVCRPVIMKVSLFTLGQGKLQFAGSQAINMADYGVKPPTILFGTIKARPEITIQFKTNFINKENQL
jgi:polyisoprenoid-binding protein YceI